MNRIIVSKKDTENIIRLYTKENMTIKEIAPFYKNKFSARVVHRILKENNVPLRKGTRDKKRKKTSPAHKHTSEIIHAYTIDKLSIRATAEKFNTSVVTIQNILRQNKIRKRSLKEARKYRPDKYGYQEPLKNRIIALRQQDNENIQDIAAKVGKETKEVYQILLDNNALISRPKPKWEQKK